MKFLHFASALALAVTMGGTAAEAISLSQAASPAEYPPSSYQGDVYVDSRGCAYVRANIGTKVNWVPRLSRDRKSVVCGLTPTAQVAGLSTARVPAPPAPPPPAPLTTASAPVAATTTARTPLPTPAAAAPAPVSTEITRTMAVTCPSGGATARVRVGGDTVSVRCSPTQTTSKSYIVRHANGARTRLVVNPPAAAVPQAPVVAATGRSVGTGDVVAGGRVLIGGVPPGGPTNGFGNGYGVATVAAPAVAAGARTVGSLGTAPLYTRVVSEPATPQAPGGGYRFGQGYGLTTYPGAMDPVPSPDGLGNARIAVPNAPGSLPGSGAGTYTYGNGYNLAPVPNAGRVVIPEGYRPAWKDGRLNPARGPRSVQGDMQMAQTVTIDEVPMRSVNPPVSQGLLYQPNTGLGTIFSSKSPTAVPATVTRTTAPAAATTASAAAPAKRYVQVGMFAVASNADAAAAKLRGLGLPGRVAQTASGKTVVIAGPYDSVSAVNAALSTARRGFPDAFLRN